MTSYIQFPRYCLFLIPDKNFTDDFNNFCFQNSIDDFKLNSSIYRFHSTVKAPFYLSHLYSENLLIEKFQNINEKTIFSLLSKAYLVDRLDYFRKSLVLRFHQDNHFDFKINSLMRDFDIYRKTLNNSEIQKDIKRFDQLSQKELIYYQIWGYPFYFECFFHHITLPIHQEDKLDYLNSISKVKYEKLSLLKQDSVTEKFEEISSIS